MKVFPQSAKRRQEGILLFECLIYGGALVAILAVAMSAFHQFQLRSLGLQRSTSDIARVLSAGEIWRKEVRSAETAKLLEDEDETGVELKFADRQTVYVCETNGVIRLDKGVWTQVLPGTKKASMKVEERQHTTVWTWEIELTTTEKSPRMKPLFTFLAARAKDAP